MPFFSKAILSLGFLSTLVAGAAVPALSSDSKLDLPDITPALLASHNVSESSAAFNWKADPAFLKYFEEEQALMEFKYIKDPSTNKTIPNPEFRGIYKRLQERASFNPPDGADCRINIHRDYYYATTGCGTLEHCEDASYNKNWVDVTNNRGSGTWAYFDEVNNGRWTYYPLSGHRGFSIAAAWDPIWEHAGFSYAIFSVEGKNNRDMKGSDYCWYNKGSAWWGKWGTGACSTWCSDFNW
ncbi:hypothetical protein V495_05456 [Pseudogymnoascus sp. VKM F-4514 (FW-929)]|nr:hypothetical protein V490_01798 [Pseudogymnoascus sp. VKM F-3557]KFY40379.1 hypothetical protein V495_05456 [Pseudogymnoascus sp. VKM F-4514 (FW-929)]KFY67959.1 hypothetical protein V497_00149 [Pseudogymnoascus sp. VKM F-4516 (FW-969)]